MVEIITDKGRIELELFDQVAPRHTENFRTLARQGFYDGLRFHRVVPDFVVQAGCPFTREDAHDPRAGTGDPGYRVAAEFSSEPHRRGTLAMARSADPDSAGSQFYICLADAPFLDGKYTVFGRVSGDGMAVVDQIAVGDVIQKVGVVDE